MSEVLESPAASAAVESAGWRVLLLTLLATVPVESMQDGLRVARLAVEACGADADEHLRVDVRPDRVELALLDRGLAQHTDRDTELAQAITAALREVGRAPAPPTDERPVKMIEVAIDAIDIAAVRPFWKAVLAYVDEPSTENGLIDPVRQGPSFWFQPMDEPRPQRNRVHLDLTVSPEEAEQRVAAALAAGGRLVSDAAARAFWILADVEGNEVCVCTWQDRD